MAKTKKDLYASMPILVRDGNYEILDQFDSVVDVVEHCRMFLGPKALRLSTFQYALKTGKFLKRANSFLEHDLSKETTFSMSERIEKQLKGLRLLIDLLVVFNL